MRQLCTSPKTVYKHTSYHKQTKNHWARDDPAFVVVLCALVAATAVAYCLAFGHGVGRSLLTILSVVAIDFLAVGAGIATAGWAVSNRFLRRKSQHSHAVEQSVEWMYAWDIHCNAFFPMFLLLGVLQLTLCPLLLMQRFLARILSAALWAVGASYYFYITFLGYSALPFLERTEVFLYPIGGIVAILPLSILLGLNPTSLMLKWYFPGR
ncbi:unc-50-like protein [Chlorella sorokiniana]|uniref:Unc-50-like protein n=1 Tax=Chlorella sorokiniana TaxID=3076 RepID=A0A2P6TE00_CHLSO|nr:unc-50-like protein [Chlorella sorokiniana]|eukprot:PRW20867.1 unc-50-like protein [Chlorella sorokiniana]